jgi:hypothetical protein
MTYVRNSICMSFGEPNRTRPVGRGDKNLKKEGLRVWTGFSCLRIFFGSRLLKL